MQSSSASGAGQNVQGANDSSASSSDNGSSSSSTASTPAPDGGAASQFATQTLASLLNYQQTSPTASFLASQMIDQLGSNGEISLSQIENALGATSSSQIADLTQAFNQIDTNGDGELSQSELTAAITQQQQDQQASGVGGMHHHHHHGGGGQVTSTQMATDLIDQLDPSGNGSLSLSALETALGLPTPSGASGTANASSSAGGTDGSSSTSSTTSSGTGASNSTGLASLSNTVAQEFNSLDTNGDGQISVSELASAIQSFRQAMEASWSSAWSTNQAGFSTAA